MTVELGAVETREEHARSGLVGKVGQITGEHKVMSKTVETGRSCSCNGCLTDDGTRNQAK